MSENSLPVEAASRSSDGLGAAERLAVRLLLENHGEEADALMTLNMLMRVYLHDDEPLMKDAKELRDMLLEVGSRPTNRVKRRCRWRGET